MDWEEISKERIKKEKDGFFIIKPKKMSFKVVPLFCPFCHEQMKNAQDAHCYRKYECCYLCTTYYAEPNREKWQKGWRPIISNDK